MYFFDNFSISCYTTIILLYILLYIVVIYWEIVYFYRQRIYISPCIFANARSIAAASPKIVCALS